MKRTIAILSVVVLLFTMNSTKFIADTLEHIPACGIEEHVHTGACFDVNGNAICGMVEHEHTDACYQERPKENSAAGVEQPPEEEQSVELDAIETTDGVSAVGEGVEIPAEEMDAIDLEDGSGDTDIGETAATAMETMDGAEVQPESEETRGYIVGAQNPFYLSDVIEDQGLSIAIEDVLEVGQAIENDDDPILFSCERVDGDFALFVNQDFERAALAITTEEELYVVDLLFGIAPVEEKLTAAVGDEEQTAAEEDQPVPEENAQAAAVQIADDENPDAEETPVAADDEESDAEEIPVAADDEESDTEEIPVAADDENPDAEETPVAADNENPDAEKAPAPVENGEEASTGETDEDEAEVDETKPADQPSSDAVPGEDVGEEPTEVESDETKPAGDVTGAEQAEEATDGEQPGEPDAQQGSDEEVRYSVEEADDGSDAEVDALQPAVSAPARNEFAATVDLSGVEAYPIPLNALLAQAAEEAEASVEEDAYITGDDSTSEMSVESEPIEAALSEVTLDLSDLDEAEPEATAEPEAPAEWVLDYDATVLSIDKGEDGYMLSVTQDFEQTIVTVDAGDVYVITLLNGAAPELYPAAAFTAATDYVVVNVVAEAGAFPAGTTMVVADVEDEDTISGITDRVEEDFIRVERVHAVDITFLDADGAEIEPLIPISVAMSVREVEEEKETVVVHVDDAGEAQVVENAVPAVDDGIMASAEAGEIASESMDSGMAFTADSFSVYAIVVGQKLETRAIAADGNTYRIEVTYAADANIPAGATLEVSEVTEDETYRAQVEESLEAGREIALARFFDIKIMNGEEPVQPSAPVTVRVELVGDEAPAPEAVPCAVHITEDAVDVVRAAEADEAVTFRAEGFSVWGVVYTVDFHYEVNGKVYDFSLPGGGYVSLTDLVALLGIAEADEGMEARVAAERLVSNVTAVEFSAPELLSVSRVEENTTVGAIKDGLGLACEYSAELTEEDIAAINATEVAAGDWALISLKAFDTEERLKVTLNNGEAFDIRVTDAQISQTVISASGDTYEITVTYDARAGLPEGAQLKVREITAEDEDYARIRGDIEKGLTDASQPDEDQAEEARADGEQTEEGQADATTLQPVNPVLFDIAIWDGEKEIEPREGSEVRVEVELAGSALKGMFSDEDTPLLINDAPIQVENGYVEKNLQVIHKTADGAVDIMDTFDNITAEELMATFTTDSFSSWLVFLDESATEITVGPGDSIILRPYNEWSWDNPSNQGDNWVNPSNDSAVTAAATVTPRTVTDSNLHHTFTFYELAIKNDAADKEFDVVTEGGRTIHIKVANTTPEPVNSHPPMVSTVDNAEEGITFNLYDYDQSKDLDESDNQASKWTSKTSNTTQNGKYENNSLNKGHALKFLGWGASGILPSNHWSKGILDYTGTTVSPEIVKPDLVEKTLSDGTKIKVPALKDFNEDLFYLFNPKATFEDTNAPGAVRAYKDADGLFQKGSNGYYYYNSNQNYAYWNNTTKRFEVYEHTYQQHTGKNEAGNGKPIGFFPFHQYEPDTDTDGTNGSGMNHNKYLNHHFGMDMAVEFSVPADGLDEFGNPITFEFSGDDDLWVFIDGKLVLDVGGLHQPVTASINFSNDLVKVNGQPDTYIQTMFNKSQAAGDKTWKKGDDVSHTLQVFYLERGGCDSNLSIRFNLPTRLGKAKVDVVKRDSTSNTTIPLQGAQFELYDNGRCEGTPIRTGTSNANGELSMDQLSIANATTTYYLKEKAAPNGYVRDSNIYKVRPKLDNSGKVIKDSSNNVEMEIVGPDGSLGTLSNGSIVFPNDKIEKLDVPAEKTWTDNDMTENAQVTLTIKRYKLVDLTNGLYIVQDLVKKPDNYQFQADYTVTYPDGTRVNVDYAKQFESGVYKVPNTVPGTYTIEQNIRSGVPDRYNMTNNPADFRRENVTLAEYPGAGATAQFTSTFEAKAGTLHLTASVTGSYGSKPDFKDVRYAIIDSSGKKVGSGTYAELSSGGKNLTLPIGTYSVRALNMPADPNGAAVTHTVQQNSATPSEGTTLGNIVITENGTTNVAFNSDYSNPVSNCHFQVMNRFNNSSYSWEEISNINGKRLKNGDAVTLTLYINKDRIWFDPTGSESNNVPQTSNVDSYQYLGMEGNCHKFDINFTVSDNKTIQFKINERSNWGDIVDHWTIRKANSASGNSTSSAPMAMMMAMAVSSGANISLDNDAGLPEAPEFKKYVKDDSWPGETITLNKNNTPQAWHDALKNLDATDSEGNKYYYYVSHVDETNLESGAETTCEIGTDENGKLQLISIDNYQTQGVSLNINNTVKRQGALKLTKIVTLNGVDSTTSLTDGEYVFSIAGVSGTATAGEQHTVTINFNNGRANWYRVDTNAQETVVGVDNSWSVVLNGLKAGDYTITETSQPAKMALKTVTGGKNNGNVEQKTITATVVAGDEVPKAASAQVEFTNNREETVKITVNKSWEPEPNPADNPSVTFELRRYAKKTNGTINITLKDDNGAAIKDATFELYRDGQPTGTTYTTDVNGQATATGLEGPHTYQLVQKTTPQRYTMQGDGVKTASEVLTVSDTSTAVQEVNTHDLVNKLLVTSATIELTLTDSGAGDVTQGTPIANGTFTLYKDGVAQEGVYTTGPDGKFKITVGPGRYQFVQTGTAESYRVPADPAVTPVITVVDEPWREQNYEVSKTNDLKGKGTIVVDLKKEDDNQPIEGARFQLKQGDTLIDSGVTGADGIVRFENVYEGTYTVHQVDVGNAGSDYTPAADQEAKITPNSVTNQVVEKRFTNATTAGNVTFRLWKKQSKDSNPTNWELVETIPGKKVNETYDFVATIDKGMYPNNVWFYWDTGDYTTHTNEGGTYYEHNLIPDNVSPLDASGYNNGTYGFSFKPTEDNRTYNLAIVSGWGSNDIYSFSMKEQTVMSASMAPAGALAAAPLSANSALSAVNIAAMPAMAAAANSDAWASAPADYVVDAGFTDKHIRLTLTESPWNGNFPAQDKYDKNGNPYYYYVVEIDHTPAEYSFSELTEGEPTDSDNATFKFKNRRPLLGDLELTKHVAGDGADTQKEFTFSIALEAPAGETLQAQYAYEKAGTSGTLTLNRTDSDTKATITGITLKSGETYRIIDLLEGTHYSITEADYSSDGYSPSFTAGASSGTIPGGTSAKASVEVTNTLSAGGLTVEKELNGNAKETDRDFSFRVTFNRSGLNVKAGSCAVAGAQATDITFSNGSAEVTFTLKGGQKAEFSNLPTGTAFTVEELSKDDHGYETNVSGSAGTTVDTTAKTVSGTISNAAATVTYTNAKSTTGAEASKVWKSGLQTIAWPEDVEYVKFTLYRTVNGQETAVTAADLANTAAEIAAFENPVQITKDTAGHKASWTKLPEKYLVSGTWYAATYAIRETEIKYTDKAAEAISVAAVDGKVTNELPKVDVHATKAWKNKDGSTTPPAGAHVTFTLLADNVVTTHTLRLDGTDATANGATPADTDYEGADWTAYFTQLPKYTDEGKVISYTIQETGKWTNYEVEGAETVEDGGTITNKQQTGKLAVTKEIHKSGAIDETATGTFRVGIFKLTESEGIWTEAEQAEEIKPIDVTEDGTATVKFDNLTIGDRYTVYEVDDKGNKLGEHTGPYTVRYQDNSELTIAPNTTPTAKVINDRELADIEVSKKWLQSDGTTDVTSEIQNASVTLELQRRTGEGEWTKATVPAPQENPQTITAATGDWKAGWTDLPKYEDGTLIQYKVVENAAMVGEDSVLTTPAPEVTMVTEAEDYTAVSHGNDKATDEIPNTLPTTTATINKAWGSEGTDDWPANIAVQMTLTAKANDQVIEPTLPDIVTHNEQTNEDDTTTQTAVVLLDARKTSHTWQNLPKYTNAGVEITYTVNETGMFYTSVGSDPAAITDWALAFTAETSQDGETITNKPNETELEVTKQWTLNGDDRQDQTQITFEVYQKLGGSDGTVLQFTQSGNVATPALTGGESTLTAKYENGQWQVVKVSKLPRYVLVHDAQSGTARYEEATYYVRETGASEDTHVTYLPQQTDIEYESGAEAQEETGEPQEETGEPLEEPKEELDSVALPANTAESQENDGNATGETTDPAEASITGGSITIINRDYSVSIVVEKIDETTRGATPTMLEGAKFKLYKYMLPQDGTVKSYLPYPDADHCEYATLEDGKLTIDNLHDGEYRLEESKTPDGYLKTTANDIYFKIENGVTTRYTASVVDQGRTEIPVNEDVGELMVTYRKATAAIEASQDGEAVEAQPATFTVGNTPGAALPATGGPGTTLYTVSGISLMALAAFLLLRKRSRDGL